LPDTHTFVNTFLIDPQNATTLYAGTYAGLFRSTDAGASWSLVSSELPVPTNYVASYQNSNVLYAGGTRCAGLCSTRLFRSSDGGLSWNETATSFKPNPWGWLIFKLQVDPREPDTLYMIVDEQNDELDLFRSTDAGATWTALKYGVLDVAIDPRESNAIYAATIYTTSDGVSRSTDGGANWETMNEGLPNSFVRTLALDPQNSKTIYAGTGGGLFWLVRDPVPTNGQP
jgi:photosystem II stability/assembly factor-like uncharacterized protein